jgi:hypothetical protein
VVDCLPGNHEALSLNPGTAEKKMSPSGYPEVPEERMSKEP